MTILLKAKDYVQKLNITTKEVPLKTLVPLLDHASLEEDEELQNKWAVLLSNLVDSNKNIHNHVFPYILSQVSIEEFNELEKLCILEKQKAKEYSDAVESFHAFDDTEQDSQSALFRMKRMRIVYKERDEFLLRGSYMDLDYYSIANLERLGLLKELPPPIKVDSIAMDPTEGPRQHDIEAVYSLDEESGYKVSELGKLFVEVCTLKS